jgi:hypothetical protein
MKKIILPFIAGVIAAIIIPILYSVITYKSEPNGFPDSDIFSVDVSYGIPAKAAAAVAGINMPETATDCYYCIGGLKPVMEFISFSVPSDEIWTEVKKITEKTEADFSSDITWKADPGEYGPQYQTLLFDLSSESLISSLFNISGGLNATCFVDSTRNRVLIWIRSDD